MEVGGSGDLDAEFGPGGGVQAIEAWREEGGGGFGVEVEADPFGFGFEDEAHGPPAGFVEVDGEIAGGVLVGELEGDFLPGGGVEDGGAGEGGVFELLLDDGEGFEFFVGGDDPVADIDFEGGFSRRGRGDFLFGFGDEIGRASCRERV